MAFLPFQMEQDPRGRETNFLTFTSPSANLANGSSDEVEIETGISIVDRAIIRVLGLQVQGLVASLKEDFGDEAASVSPGIHGKLSTRTGDWNIDDPELVTSLNGTARIVSDGTNTVAVAHDLEMYSVAAGGSLVATPRLVYRLVNDLAGGPTTITAHTHSVRMGFEFVPVNTNLLIELLERHADIFLA